MSLHVKKKCGWVEGWETSNMAETTHTSSPSHPLALSLPLFSKHSRSWWFRLGDKSHLGNWGKESKKTLWPGVCFHVFKAISRSKSGVSCCICCTRIWISWHNHCHPASEASLGARADSMWVDITALRFRCKFRAQVPFFRRFAVLHSL